MPASPKAPYQDATPLISPITSPVIQGLPGHYHDDPDARDEDGDDPLPDALSFYDQAALEGHVQAPKRPSLSGRLADRFIPRPIRNAAVSVAEWTKGPARPVPLTIRPILPQLQLAPRAFLEKFAPGTAQRGILLLLLYLFWLVVIGSLIGRAGSGRDGLPGLRDQPVIRVPCDARPWDACGLNGERCQPFNNTLLAFRCPSDCHKEIVQYPHPVGPEDVVYRPLVVGGPRKGDDASAERTQEGLVKDAVYRGDSYICASAIHAGVFASAHGGCGVLSLLGERSGYRSSTQHGIASTSFDSYFPQSFGFLESARHPKSCRDPRWPALFPSVLATVFLSIFTIDPRVQFWSVFTMLFFHTALLSDPALEKAPNYYSLLALAIGRFLPACFCMWVMYTVAVSHTLTNLTAQVEKTVLWLGAAWIGALNNYTFDWIPIQRLTPHDIQAQPGAVPALLGILAIILAIALGQAWCFRVEGRMRRGLALYGAMIAVLLVGVVWPNMSLRIHHYLLALILLPGTRFQTRLSLFYQGLLIGLFINGVARWGFAPLLESSTELLAGAPRGTLIPRAEVLEVSGATLGVAASAVAQNITFSLGPLPVVDPVTKLRFDGISVMVNDVERWHHVVADSGEKGNAEAVASSRNLTWTWMRHHPVSASAQGGVDDDGDDADAAKKRPVPPEYFRFAYVAGKHIDTVDPSWSYVGDYSAAGLWTADGSWSGPEDS